MGVLKKILSFKNDKKTLLCIGLDNSGKTSIINYLKPKKRQCQIIKPTIAYSIDELNYEKTKYTVIDMSGQTKYINMWEQYYDDIDGLIIVIDSTDKLRIPVLKSELDVILSNENISKIPMLFLANKKDLDNALTANEITDMLDLNNLNANLWKMFDTSIIINDGEGIKDGFKWLSDTLSQFH